jgi:hypothetical protein
LQSEGHRILRAAFGRLQMVVIVRVQVAVMSGEAALRQRASVYLRQPTLPFRNIRGELGSIHATFP